MEHNDPYDTMIMHLTGRSNNDIVGRNNSRAIIFPVKLMYVLECGAYDDIVQWCANGRAFVVLNPKDFEKKILPELFREAKYTSFEKKVKRWGFIKARVKRGAIFRCYGHPNFQEGGYDRCLQMKCLITEERSHHFYRPSLLSPTNLLEHSPALSTTSPGIGHHISSDGRLEQACALLSSSYAEDNSFRFESGVSRADRESTVNDPIYYDDPLHTISAGIHGVSRLKNTLNSPECFSTADLRPYIFNGGIFGANSRISAASLRSNQYVDTDARSSSEKHKFVQQLAAKIDYLGGAGRYRPSNQTLRSYCDRLQAQSYTETASGVILRHDQQHGRVRMTNAKIALLELLERSGNPVSVLH